MKNKFLTFLIAVFLMTLPLGAGANPFTNEGGVPVSEPATMLLLGFGLIGIARLGRKKLIKKS